jgi:putative tricarboxylic transport membrane protein
MADHDQAEDQPGDQGRNKASASSFVHFTDLWLTVLILGVCAWLYYVTTGFEEVSPLLAQNIGPEWFPRLLIWTIVVLSLMLPFEHRLKGSQTDSIDEDRANRIKPMAVYTALLMLAVVGVVHLFGTLGGMIAVCIALPLLWGERRAKVLVPYVLLFPPAVALLFTKVLKVYFEAGAFGIAIGS